MDRLMVLTSRATPGISKPNASAASIAERVMSMLAGSPATRLNAARSKLGFRFSTPSALAPLWCHQRAVSTGLLPPLGPHLLKRPPLGDGEVAVSRPAAGERQRAEAAAVHAAIGEDPHGEAREELIEARPLGEKGPDAEAVAIGRRRQVPLEFAFAPVAHHV